MSKFYIQNPNPYPEFTSKFYIQNPNFISRIQIQILYQLKKPHAKCWTRTPGSSLGVLPLDELPTNACTYWHCTLCELSSLH